MAALIYGGLCYTLFLLTFVYSIGFVGNIFVPKSIDTDAASPVTQALIVNVILLGLFAIQHSVMARPVFKQWWTKFVPKSVERSTYVLLASLVLILLFWQWRPIPTVIWSVTSSTGAGILTALFWVGWVTVLISTFLINHFNLFGLQQVYANWQGRNVDYPTFQTPLFYKFVRHPIYFGFLLAFWAAPLMTAGHLLFAIATTAYIFIAIPLEEHDLVSFHGDEYIRYREVVSMIVPLPQKRAATRRDGRLPSSENR
jgi:methanethiol S-methyltransferase